MEPLEDKESLRFLHKLIDGSLREITEKRRVEVKIEYPEIEGVSATLRGGLEALLNRLAGQGVLARIPYDNTLCCPHCGSIQLYTEFFCPRCDSIHLCKDVVLEHYRCGFVEVRPKFLDGPDYVCPKCRQVLRQLGVDYRRVGATYECTDCGEKFSEPAEKWLCQQCKSVFETREASLKPLYTYKLTREGRNLLLEAFFNVDRLVEGFRAQGYRVESPYRVRDGHGIEHIFDLKVVGKGSKSHVDALLRIFKSPASVRHEDILAFYAEAEALKPLQLVAVALPQLSEEARKYAEAYRIISLEGERAEEIVEKIPSIRWEAHKMAWKD